MQERKLYHNGRTYEEHCAWIAAMSEDERSILSTPDGYKMELISIGWTKHILLNSKMGSRARLELLEGLHEFLSFRRDAPEIIAIVEPLSDVAYEMVHEAMKLGAKEAFKLLEQHDVFCKLCAAAPSMMTAIRHIARRSH